MVHCVQLKHQRLYQYALPLSEGFQHRLVHHVLNTEYSQILLQDILPVPGRPTILITVGQGPTALAVGAGGGCLDIFILIYPFSSFSLSLGDGPI